MKIRFNSNVATWIIFASLLGVLLPHTAWTFARFEDTKAGWLGIQWGLVISYIAAFAFEAMIALLTHKLSRHIEQTPRKYRRDKKGRFSYRYLNEYGFGLIFAWAVSTLANLSHAVQFNQGMAIITKWNLSEWLFTVAFGGILPTVSFLFARVLSNTVDEEDEPENERIEQTQRTNIERTPNLPNERIEQGQNTKRDQVITFLQAHPDKLGQVTSVAKTLNMSKGYVSMVMKEQLALSSGSD